MKKRKCKSSDLNEQLDLKSGCYSTLLEPVMLGS